MVATLLFLLEDDNFAVNALYQKLSEIGPEHVDTLLILVSLSIDLIDNFLHFILSDILFLPRGLENLRIEVQLPAALFDP